MLNAILVLVWIVYLFQIQILDAHNLKSTIEIRQNPSKKIIIPLRGNIYDCNRNLLVSSVKYYQIDLDIPAVKNYCGRNDKNLAQTVGQISEVFSKYTDMDQTSLQNKLLNANCSVFISENISETQLYQITTELDKLNINSLNKNFSKIRRTYPQGKLGSNFLGMVDDNRAENSNEEIYKLQGISGLESTYDSELRGKYGWKESIHDANNRRIPLLDLKEKQPEQGHSLVLSIDNDLQEILDESLNEGIKKYQAKNAIGIIMDPQTGAILAMSGINEKDEERTALQLRSTMNLPASFMFEPGSTLKPITALLALEKRIYKPSDVIDCRNYHLKYGNVERVIKDDHKFTKLNFKDIIAHSSNVGISKIVEKIGSETLYERLIAMGFGHKISADVAGEAAGIFRKLKDWQGFSLHSISFGQEISVTALQLANAYCAMANGGKIMQPYLVQQILDGEGRVVENHQPRVLRRISDQASLDTLKVFLKSVVDYGTGTGTKFDFLTVAGKTGTSEKSFGGTNGYAEEKYTSIFAGFFPVEEPKYTIVIVYDEPDYKSYSYYSALSAVPTFKKVVSRLISLPKSDVIVDIKEENREFVFAPAVFGMSRLEAESTLKNYGIKFEIVEKNADGVVVNQFPKPNTAFDKNESIIVILDTPTAEQDVEVFNYDMPNLRGLTLRKALAQANRKNIRLVSEGVGCIYEQSIQPGTKTKFGEKCVVKAR